MKELTYFDGQLTSVTSNINTTHDVIRELQAEIKSLHDFMDRMGVPRYTGTGSGGQKLIGERYQELVDRNSNWSEIQK